MKRKQLNIRLDEKIHKRAKIAAILKGETLNSYIEKAILDALEKDDNKDKIDKLENEK